MDVNYRVNFVKWLPPPSPDLQRWFTDSIKLNDTMKEITRDITRVSRNIALTNTYDKEAFRGLIHDLEDVLKDYEKLFGGSEMSSTNPIYRCKIRHLSTALKRNLNIIAECTRVFLNDIIDYKSNDILYMTFRLINVYNDMLDKNRDVSDTTVNIFYNDCPSMLEPLKKLSVTRILQILAKNRAEGFCEEFIDCFLSNYKPRAHQRPWTDPDYDSAENSSIEIYRILTEHVTPPSESKRNSAESTPPDVESIQALMTAQHEQVLRILNVIQDVSPGLFGSDAMKTTNGEKKLRGSAIRKAVDYFHEISWGAASNILDHVILWWSPEALDIRKTRDGAIQLKDWLCEFLGKNAVSVTVRSALRNLCDALAYHAAITLWDHLFRLAYTSSFQCRSGPSSTKGTDTGRMFLDVLKFLVESSNGCETLDEWVAGAPLAELPLSEQIVVLHRLDHSIHTCRIWATLEAKTIAHSWDLKVFFLLVKADIVDFVEQLSRLKLADYSNTPSAKEMSVQVHVCARMRTKICSEVKANAQLLKDSPRQCIDTLANICRVTCLASLHMCFPARSYWRGSSVVPPNAASPYVGTYFEKILLPVVEVLDDTETSNMILRIMCEAWLDYIYLHRIKFSEYGALQLLTDFAYVSTWVTECPIISANVKNHLLKNEVLRRCEGVGRLLLRQRGESIAMRKGIRRRTEENESPESLGLERMPAEMYVPNQEQWLELRASKHYHFCCTE